MTVDPTQAEAPVDPLLTVEEVSARLRCSEETLYRWRVSGTGPRFIRVGKRTHYKASDIEAWLEAHAEGGAK